MNDTDWIFSGVDELLEDILTPDEEELLTSGLETLLRRDSAHNGS